MKTIINQNNLAVELGKVSAHIALEGAKKPIVVEIKDYKEKRSSDANSYFHVLMNKIARKLDSSDDEVKIELNKKYGVLVEDEELIIREHIDVSKHWDYTKHIGTTTGKNGKPYNIYLLYKRTRDLDRSEMAKLIDGVIYEAKELEIETLPPNEIARLMSMWG